MEPLPSEKLTGSGPGCHSEVQDLPPISEALNSTPALLKQSKVGHSALMAKCLPDILETLGLTPGTA